MNVTWAVVYAGKLRTEQTILLTFFSLHYMKREGNHIFWGQYENPSRKHISERVSSASIFLLNSAHLSQNTLHRIAFRVRQSMTNQSNRDLSPLWMECTVLLDHITWTNATSFHTLYLYNHLIWLKPLDKCKKCSLTKTSDTSTYKQILDKKKYQIYEKTLNKTKTCTKLLTRTTNP